MRRQAQLAVTRGMRYTAPGIRASTPGTDRALEPTDPRGMRDNSPARCEVVECAERRGMRYNTPSIRASTPGSGRESELAERRGIQLNTPGIGRESELAERQGMRDDAQSSCF